MQQSSSLLNSALKVKINHSSAVKNVLNIFLCYSVIRTNIIFSLILMWEKTFFKQGLFNDGQDTRSNDASPNLLGTDFLRCGYYDL